MSDIRLPELIFLLLVFVAPVASAALVVWAAISRASRSRQALPEGNRRP